MSVVGERNESIDLIVAWELGVVAEQAEQDGEPGTAEFLRAVASKLSIKEATDKPSIGRSEHGSARHVHARER